MLENIKSYIVVFSCAALVLVNAPETEAKDELLATHGVMSAEVTHSSAIVWSRSERPALMHVELQPRNSTTEANLSTGDRLQISEPSDGQQQGNRGLSPVLRSVEVAAASDYTGHVEFDGLRANTRYRYSVWFSPLEGDESNAERSSAEVGYFTTAPDDSSAQPLKLIWSGDFAGQNVCRDAVEGFPVFNAMAAEQADLFIGLGDMIYADNTCEPVGRYGNKQVPGDFPKATDLPSFWAHWRYNRDDAGFLKLLKSTPYYGVWDDHEVVNDFGPQTDSRTEAPYTEGKALLPIGLKAFLDYTPIKKRDVTPHRLYRNVRWGRHAELFFLDNRQYRDANRAPDSETFEKTMLGREQLTWLVDKLEASDATWNIIVSSVPVSIPTGYPSAAGRDGWANFDENTELTLDGIKQSKTGFERELGVILSTLKRKKANVLFITTDVHFAEVFRYSIPDGDDPFTFHEVVIGPGNSGIFPNRDFDKSLGTESLFFYGPPSAEAVTSWEEAKKWFNYGVIDISRSGELAARVKKTDGDEVFTLALKL